MSYDLATVSEIIDEISMGPFGSNIKVECFVDEGIPVLNGSNVDTVKLREDSFRFVTREKADSLGKANAFRGDIVVTHRGTLGQIAIIPTDSKYQRYVISQSQFRMRCNLERVLPEFVVYYFHTREGQHQILSNKSQVGVPALARPTTTFQSLTLPLPSLAVQKKIIQILSCLDDKIELNNRINKNLEAQAQAIFKSWFVDFEPFQDGEFVDSELGQIPKGWEVGTIANLGDIVGGSTPSKAKPEYYTDKGIAWLTPKDLSIQKNKFIFHGETDITELGLKNSSARLMPKGTVLFSSRAPIGYMAIAGNEVSTNQGFKSIVPFSHIGTPYVYFYLKTNLERIESSASGSTFREVSGSTMKNITALIPCKNALIQFTQLCDTIFLQQQKLVY